MKTHVQLDAYGLLVITTKAKSKFKAYCINVKKYPLIRETRPHIYIDKKILGINYKVRETIQLDYSDKMSHVINGNRSFICPMYDTIVKYHTAASRSRISNTSAIFNIPFAEYNEILNIAEYGNY